MNSLHQDPMAKMRQWLRRHRTLVFCVMGTIVIAGVGITSFVLLNQNQKSPETPADQVPSKPAPKPEPVYYSLLTGEKVPDEAAKTAPVTAIMIENSPDARPQSGLKSAGAVYEAIAEGGITRFLAIYQHEKPELIGPVRSLRMYYVDWLAPYNASVAHVGGSKNALSEIRNGNYRDIDQFFNDKTYWRATDRYAPHNVYTSFANLDALNKAKGYTESTFNSFPRTDGKPSEEPNATSVAINFSSSLYNTSYQYNAESNTYARSLAGAPHMDREAGQLNPSVVVAMYVTMQHVMEDGYREQIVTTGNGRAVVFQNGNAIEATWQKADRASPLKLFDEHGQELSLIRGQTWIAAVPNTGGSVSWQ